MASTSELDRVFSALAHPLRRGIITELAADPNNRERACGSFHLPVSKGSRTHHFKVLREAGLIDQADYGNWSGVTLRREHLESRYPGLLGVLAGDSGGRARTR